MGTVEGFWSFHVILGKNYSKHGVGNHKPTFPAGTTRPLRIGLVHIYVYICIYGKQTWGSQGIVIMSSKTRTLTGHCTGETDGLGSTRQWRPHSHTCALVLSLLEIFTITTPSCHTLSHTPQRQPCWWGGAGPGPSLVTR